MGLSRGHWSDIVNGNHPYPSAKTRKILAEVFDVPTEVLFEAETSEVTDQSDADFQAAIASRYLVDREIGQGGMGTVFLARDVKLGRQVAVKVVSSEAVGGIGASQFLKEIRYTARLQHENILPMHDADEAAGQPFYVMPWIKQGSLRERIKKTGQLPVADVLRITSGIAEALNHAHDQRILHCDVKPENVLLAGNHAYVADFGIARAIHAEAFEWGRRDGIDSSAGTPAYVSPEQASGESNLDARSDVYSLACMVYEMLAGTPPFGGTTTMEVVSKRFTSAPPSLKTIRPDLPTPLVREVERAMSFDGKHRHQTTTEFSRRLRSAATRTPRPLIDFSMRFAATTLITLRNITGIKPTSKTGMFMDSIWQDIGYAFRSLMRKPGFALIAIVTLALGIGANTAIFSVINGVLLRPLPFREPEQLMRVGDRFGTGRNERSISSMSPANFLTLREETETLEDLVAQSSSTRTLTGGGDPQRISVQQVSWGFFQLLGVPLQMGRAFVIEDDSPGAAPVAILANRMWRNRYDSDPNVLGTTIMLNDISHEVIGVLPEIPDLPGDPALWLPFAWSEETRESHGSRFMAGYGRLKPGITREESMGELRGIFQQLREEAPQSNTDWDINMWPLHDWWYGRSSKSLYLLGGAVSLVLLIACVNVANLLLARLQVRQRELAVRAALGANRFRLLRHFLSESVLISTLGGVAGLGVAVVGLRAMSSLMSAGIPRSTQVSIDGGVLGFALLMSLLTGVLVGLVPMLQSGKINLNESLKEGGRGSTGNQTRLRQALVVSEVALAVMLVAGAALLIQSFWRIQQVDLGVNTDGLLTVRLETPESRYPELENVRDFYRDVLEQVEALPDVVHVGAVNRLPFLSGNSNITRLGVVGEPDREATFVEIRYVSASFFASLGVPILQGRTFDQAIDGPDSKVAIINDVLERRLLAQMSPLTTQLLPWGPTGAAYQIVGLVPGIKEFGPDREAPPTLYLPQNNEFTRSSMSLTVRTKGDPLVVLPAIRQVVRNIDPDIPLYAATLAEDMVADRIGDRTLTLTLLAIFAVLALTLGTVGIYGVMSYTVEQRTKEVGVRLALGASGSGIIRLVVMQGAKMTLVGIGIGLLGSLAFSSVITSLLFETRAIDPLTYLAVATVLTIAALTACYVPARRAATVNPVDVIRAE